MASSHAKSYTPFARSVRCQPLCRRIHETPVPARKGYALAGSNRSRSSFSKPSPRNSERTPARVSGGGMFMVWMVLEAIGGGGGGVLRRNRGTSGGRTDRSSSPPRRRDARRRRPARSRSDAWAALRRPSRRVRTVRSSQTLSASVPFSLSCAFSPVREAGSPERKHVFFPCNEGQVTGGCGRVFQGFRGKASGTDQQSGKCISRFYSTAQPLP